MTMIIFVTGGTGFVGQNLVEYLLNRPEKPTVYCLARDLDKTAHIKALGARIVHGDLLDPESYKRIAQQAELVFHCAALVGLKDGSPFYPANRDATDVLLSVLRSAPQQRPMPPIQRFVFVSSIAAVDRHWQDYLDNPDTFNTPLDEESRVQPSTDYGKSKLEAEELIIHSGLPYTILRPAYIYGPYPRINSSIDRSVTETVSRQPYTQFPFPGYASGIYVKDLAKALWESTQHAQTQNETYFIANRTPLHIGTFFKHIHHALNLPYTPRNMLPIAMARFQRFQFATNPGNPVPRILYTRYFHCSAEKFYSHTGYQASTSVEDALQATVQWYLDAGRLEPLS